MSDPNFNVTKHSATTKPRLSLLSSKQSGIRLKSDDQLDQQISVSNTTEDYVNVSDNDTCSQREQKGKQFDDQQESRRLNGGQTQTQMQTDENRTNFSKEDLIRLLSMLKTELQSKEIALAAIKCEQLKRLINPVEISRSSLANTYIELQDRFKKLDQNNNDKVVKLNTTSASCEDQENKIAEKNVKDENDDETDKERLNILNTLLELLDRHPLLALPRDAVYCLDYNCNELSTKNYLNLKIQHLDNLINQHRRFRYYMNERLKKSEQCYLELNHQMQVEKLLKSDIEKAAFRASGKAILMKHIEEVKEELEKEKRDKQVIVMTLLNQLLDERERSQSLADKLTKTESNSMKNTADVIGERERLLETEVTNLTMQLKKQSIVSAKERNELESTVSDLKTENLSLKARLEQQETRLAALIKTSANSNQKSKEPGQTATASSPSRSSTESRPNIPLSRQNSNNTTPAVITRVTNATTRASPPPKNSSATQNINSASKVAIGDDNARVQQKVVSRQSPSSSSSNQKTAAPSIMSRLVGGTSSTESSSTPIRIQPLFKSSSVSSSNQQSKNLKNSVSSSSNASSTASPRISTNNQSVTKPRVPAKPAQLLDQQRNSIN